MERGSRRRRAKISAFRNPSRFISSTAVSTCSLVEKIPNTTEFVRTTWAQVKSYVADFCPLCKLLKRIKRTTASLSNLGSAWAGAGTPETRSTISFSTLSVAIES
jgi:hypothetical protein